jgi:spermidine/putrescine transport system ATP-binding protein
VSTAALEFRDLCKRFASVRALDGISLEIQPGEFFSLLGPSGCGKTTLLRIAAGFETPDGGELRIAGTRMDGIPPQERSVNTVFQNYALFPHLNVFDNVAFGLRMKKTPSSKVSERVEKALGLVHIAELRERFPSQISGGQKQRVALARALINEPKVLLLDEPLAAIDAKLRAELQTELKKLQRSLGTTFIYVTHDQDEALALSDRVAVMRAGRVEQVGAPNDVYERPRNRFVASFVGACNILEAALASSESRTIAKTAIGSLFLPDLNPNLNPNLFLAIRRENVLLNSASVGLNTFTGIIQDVSFNGAHTAYTLLVNGVTICATKPSTAGQHRAGESVAVCFPPEALRILEP